MIKKILILLFAGFLIIACEKASKPLDDVKEPTFNPEAGTYIAPLTGLEAVEIECATNGATIRYTIDGTDPTISSAAYSSSSPISISSATTIKAKAYKDGMNPSAITTAEYSFAVASVTIYPISGNYTTPQTIQIQSVTPGTIIHYTMGGSDPTESSPLYTSPFVVNASVTVKAKGFIAGWIPSATASVVYNYNVSSLMFNPVGGSYTMPLAATITNNSPNSVFHFTTDGSDPSESSETYSAPIQLDGNTVLKARGYLTGWNPSSITSATYSFDCSVPTFSLNEGTYNNNINVSMNTTTPGGEIRYTTDGSIPSESSALYSGTLNVSVSTSFKARTFKTNWNPSNTASASYTLKVTPPTFNPVPGSYNAPLEVTINCATPGVTIYYTIDGTTPTTASDLYSAPLTFISYTVLRARAYKTGWSSSDVTQGNYIVSQTQPVEIPIITPTGGTYTAPQRVVITCPTNGATIRYTTDGSEPTADSEEYIDPLTVSDNTTVKARAFKLGWIDSPTASASYVINFTLGQMISVPGGTFFMGNLTATGYPADETPEHQVTVSGFSIGKYQVTQLEWQTVMSTSPAFFAGNLYNPVENMSWYEALVYCNRRSILESLTPVYSINSSANPDNWGAIPTINDDAWNTVVCNWSANGYRLPTEAEWEYAARGATSPLDYLFSGSNNAIEVAWFRLNSEGRTHIVGHLSTNQLGIHDMSGNVNEWCWDWYLANYYETSPASNPTGPDSPGSAGWRTARGGDWDSYNDDLVRIKNREGKVPYYHTSSYGLRIARSNSRRN